MSISVSVTNKSDFSTIVRNNLSVLGSKKVAIIAVPAIAIGVYLDKIPYLKERPIQP